MDLLNANGCAAYTSTSDAGGCGQSWTPTPSPPPPTNNCASTQNFVKVTLVTDNYGAETEWKVRDPKLKKTYMQAKVGSLASNKESVQQACIPKSGTVTFEIKDKVGGKFRQSLRGSWR